MKNPDPIYFRDHDETKNRSQLKITKLIINEVIFNSISERSSVFGQPCVRERLLWQNRTLVQIRRPKSRQGYSINQITQYIKIVACQDEKIHQLETKK